MTEEVPRDCSLLLEVYTPVSIYENELEEVEWEVGSDPTHPFPYLLAPTQYAEQEIDPIRCTASIGTVEVGVIDKAMTPGDQTTGWMTARVNDLLGRRCRLRRWVNEDIGWVVIADGPAGMPRMDNSYAAYRWTIRDTRETERKLAAFQTGGTIGICPHRPIYGFGRYTDDDGDHLLLDPALETPIVGNYVVSAAGPYFLGTVTFADHYTPGVGPEPPTVDTDDMVLDEEGQSAIELTELLVDTWGARYADILWRLAGSSAEWNVSRPVSPTTFRQPIVGTSEAFSQSFPEDVQIVLNYVTLFVDTEIPDGFPTGPTEIEVIVRYRGPATEAYPYYVEDALGEVLQNLYNGVYSVVPTDQITGMVYDPAELDGDLNFVTRVQYDPDVFALMVEAVRLRQTSAIEDARAWTETALYAPSGWIPALDNDMRISPVSRNRPSSVNPALVLDDEVTVPAPNWQTGERTVSEIQYTYPRYFVPEPDSGIETLPDGLAQRDVTIAFKDAEGELRYGPQVEQYDASAFAAVGAPDGLNLDGQLEQANTLAQTAKFEVLDRFRAGVQSINISVRRNRIPNVRVGDWVPWELVHLPDRLTGLRGSAVAAAQVVSLRDDNCTWRQLTLEEAEESAGEPGTVTLLEVYDDQPGAGDATLMVESDEESS